MKSSLTFAQRLKIHERLKQMATSDGNGTCTYKEGFSDDVVAKEFGFSRSNVAGVRRETLGDIRKARTVAAHGIEDRITMIEDFLTSKWPDWRDKLDPDLFRSKA